MSTDHAHGHHEDPHHANTHEHGADHGNDAHGAAHEDPHHIAAAAHGTHEAVHAAVDGHGHGAEAHGGHDTHAEHGHGAEAHGGHGGHEAPDHAEGHGHAAEAHRGHDTHAEHGHGSHDTHHAAPASGGYFSNFFRRIGLGIKKTFWYPVKEIWNSATAQDKETSFWEPVKDLGKGVFVRPALALKELVYHKEKLGLYPGKAGTELLEGLATIPLAAGSLVERVGRVVTRSYHHVVDGAKTFLSSIFGQKPDHKALGKIGGGGPIPLSDSSSHVKDPGSHRHAASH